MTIKEQLVDALMADGSSFLDACDEATAILAWLPVGTSEVVAGLAVFTIHKTSP